MMRRRLLHAVNVDMKRRQEQDPTTGWCNSGVAKKKSKPSSETNKKTTTCKLCGDEVETVKFLLIQHIEWNCDNKQFRCPIDGCTFKDDFLKFVQFHIEAEHLGRDLDSYDVDLKMLWLSKLDKCFPMFTRECIQKGWVYQEFVGTWFNRATPVRRKTKSPATSQTQLEENQSQDLQTKATEFLNELQEDKEKSESSSLTEDKTTNCKICKIEVETKQFELIEHSKSHCDVRQFKCSACDYSDNQFSLVQNHIDSVHQGEADLLDKYELYLLVRWLQTFKNCFPLIAYDCYTQAWEFRSKAGTSYNEKNDGSTTNLTSSSSQQQEGQPSGRE